MFLICTPAERTRLTCPGVNSEETLGIATGDPVRQPVAGSGVWINSVDLDDWHVFGRVLHDRGVVDRLRRLRCIVIDVLDLDEDFHEGRQRHHATVHGVDREPVVGYGLVIKQLLGPDDTWRTREMGASDFPLPSVVAVFVHIGTLQKNTSVKNRCPQGWQRLSAQPVRHVKVEY